MAKGNLRTADPRVTLNRLAQALDSMANVTGQNFQSVDAELRKIWQAMDVLYSRIITAAKWPWPIGYVLLKRIEKAMEKQHRAAQAAPLAVTLMTSTTIFPFDQLTPPASPAALWPASSLRVFFCL